MRGGGRWPGNDVAAEMRLPWPGGRSRFRPGAPIRASLDPRGGGECRAVTAWPPRLGPQRWIGGPPIARKARAPETASPPGAKRNRSINTARGTPWVWRTCGLPAVARKSVGGPDFDKPRCRDASRSAGPIGPLASRAPLGTFSGSGAERNDERTRRSHKKYGRRSYALSSSRPSAARAGTHTPQSIERARRMGPRLRGDDNKAARTTAGYVP